MTALTDDNRRFLAGGLFSLAGGLYTLAQALPLHRNERSGWHMIGEIIQSLINESQSPNSIDVALMLAVLYSTCIFPIAADAAAAGFRTFGRATAVMLVVTSGTVAGFFAWADPPTLRDIERLVREGPGGPAWFACFPMLAAAAFVWPRPSAPPS